MTKQARTHTLESLFASCEEVGSCLEWNGRFNNKSPMVYQDGTYIPTRRLVLLLSNKKVAKGSTLGTTCGNWRCICKSHIVARTTSEHSSHMATRVNYGSSLRLAKIQKSARRRAILTEEQAQQILLDPRPAKIAAPDFKISKSLVYRIRSGKAWRNVSSPWASLLSVTTG